MSYASTMDGKQFLQDYFLGTKANSKVRQFELVTLSLNLLLPLLLLCLITDEPVCSLLYLLQPASM